jgi:hypothetical protein
VDDKKETSKERKMYKGKLVYLLFMTAMLLTLVSGCASKNGAKSAAKDAGQYVGFLSDYSMLAPATDKSDAMVYRKPGVDLKQYNKIMLDRITIWLKDDAEYKGVDPTEMKALTDYFHEAFVRELGTDYPLVQEPGPGVLRMRIAITNLKQTKPALSVVTLIMPYGTGTVADLAAGTATGNVGHPPYLGEAAIEAEFLDSVTNEQVAAYVEQRLGKKFDTQGEGARGAVSNYSKAYSQWGYVKQAFDFWAHKLRVRLDEIQGK